MQNNIFQAEYAYVNVVHSLIVEKLATSSKWQTEAALCGTPFDDLWNRLMGAPGFHDEHTVDAITDMVTTNARNIKMPNSAQRMTIFLVLELFLNNWTIKYCIAVAVKQSMPSISSLSQYLCTLTLFYISECFVSVGVFECPYISQIVYSDHV